MLASTKEFLQKQLRLNNINSTHPEVMESTPVEPYTNDESEPPNDNLGNGTISVLVAIRDTPSVNPEGLPEHEPDRESHGEPVEGQDQPRMTLLAQHFRLTHMMGLTPSSYESALSFNLKTILFVVVGTLSVFNAFSTAKFYYLYGMQDAQKAKQMVLSYITLGNYINILLLRIVFIVLMCLHAKKFNDIVETSKEWFTLFRANSVHQPKGWPIGVIFGLSVFTAIISPVLFAVSHGKNITKLLLWHSNEFAKGIFLWKREIGYEAADQLFDDYGTNSTNRNMALGVTHLVTNIARHYHEACVRDFCLVFALSMYHMTQQFQNQLSRCVSQQERGEEYNATIWKMYKLLRRFSEQLEECMGLLINLVHVDTVIFSAYFLFDRVIESGNHASLSEIHMIFKLFCFYYVSTMASGINSSFRAWIINNFPSGQTPFIDNGGHVRTSILLNDLTNRPIGVGSSVCFIDKTFLWKILSIVGSFFIFFADVREDEIF